ncbi:MAG TPA: MGMT family protein [Acidimicrobiales bacterium]|nr:MGMT family protein [Acidimicrobiales bacterium]
MSSFVSVLTPVRWTLAASHVPPTSAALGRNPVCILVPCHRVVGAGGKLTGYAGGLARKQRLLDLEAEELGWPWRLF